MFKFQLFGADLCYCDQVLKSIANSVHIREDGQLGDNNNEGEIKWTGQETEFLQNVAMCLKVCTI